MFCIDHISCQSMTSSLWTCELTKEYQVQSFNLGKVLASVVNSSHCILTKVCTGLVFPSGPFMNAFLWGPAVPDMRRPQ